MSVRAVQTYIEVVDGRAIYQGEDWGKVYAHGEKFLCCGCPFGFGRHTKICDCRCHDVHRQFWANHVDAS